MIQKLNQFVEYLTQRGTFTSMVTVIGIFLLLKLYIITHGK